MATNSQAVVLVASAMPSDAPASSQSDTPARPARLILSAIQRKTPSQTATSKSFFALVASCQAMGVVRKTKADSH